MNRFYRKLAANTSDIFRSVVGKRVDVKTRCCAHRTVVHVTGYTMHQCYSCDKTAEPIASHLN